MRRKRRSGSWTERSYYRANPDCSGSCAFGKEYTTCWNERGRGISQWIGGAEDKRGIANATYTAGRLRRCLVLASGMVSDMATNVGLFGEYPD